MIVRALIISVLEQTANISGCNYSAPYFEIQTVVLVDRYCQKHEETGQIAEADYSASAFQEPCMRFSLTKSTVCISEMKAEQLPI